MELSNSTQQPANTPNNQVSATDAAITSFSIAGIIKIPAKHASMVATIGAVFTVLFLLDLFLDINPIKDMYLKAFPRKEDALPS